jgi:ribosomal protein S18 acetylase RimI-like enzyme
VALTSHPFASIDDLRAMQAAVTQSWLSPRRPLVSCTTGDLTWWFARGEPGVDWSERIRIWTVGARTVGWGWLSPPAELEWFVAGDVEEADERRIRIEILDWARASAAGNAPSDGEPSALEVWAADGWLEQGLIAGLGFTPTGFALTQYFQSLERELPGPAVPDGYVVRSLAGPAEIPARVDVHRAAFAPSKLTVAMYELLVRLPPYRYDLDAVVEAPDGTLAAFTLAWLDAEASLGYFEPVGTHPDHQRRGLGKAVSSYALRRLRDEGAREAMVYSSTANDGSEALYRSVGFRPIAVHRRYAAPALQSAR